MAVKIKYTFYAWQYGYGDMGHVEADKAYVDTRGKL